MQTWDVIVVGGGIIGLSLAIALRKRGARVLIVERGEPAREASHAAAGMLDNSPLEIPRELQSLAAASAKMYPEFVHELQDESGVNIDLREQGTLLVHPAQRHLPADCAAQDAPPDNLAKFEPALRPEHNAVAYLKERSVDPRALGGAALKAAKHRAVDIASGSEVESVLIERERAVGVATRKTEYRARTVVNCAGAWAGQIGPQKFPTRPVKGQMLAVVGGPAVHHVIRTPGLYLVPRGDGRIVIGSTLEDAGFDKRTNPDTIRQLLEAARRLVPGLRKARILEDWAGLRPGTPDDLPILGATSTPGYFVATGHFRDGILLAPVTAQVMAQIVMGAKPEHDLAAFSADRFAS